VTPEQLKALTDQVDAEAAQAPSPSAPAPEAQAPEAQAPAAPEATGGFSMPSLADIGAGISDFTQSMVGGASKAVWETKDFFAGEPSEQEKSTLRKNIEANNKRLSEASGLNSFTMGVSQFAVGILGAGKITGALRIGAKVGKVAKGVVDGALAGAVAFDPHEERFSDIVESFPAASNFATRYLKSDPTDSAAEGRFKNALESIGLDLTIIGVLALGGKVLRAGRSGDKAAVEAAQAELAEATAKMEAKDAKAASGSAPQGGQAASDAVDPAGRPDAGPGVRTATGEAQAADTGLTRAADDAVTLEVVDSPTQAGAPRRDAGSPMMEVQDADLAKIARGADKDFKALASHGSWQAAVEAGHVFGKGGSIPWQVLSQGAEPSTAVDAVIARVAQTLAPQLDAAKGGKVLSDAQVNKQVADLAAFWGEDPGALLGAVRAAGENAQQSVQLMRAAYMVSQSTMQDAFTMAARIRGGYLGEFGGDRGAAIELLRKQVEVMASSLGAANSIRANAGRALRQNRSEFRLKPEDIANLKSLDEDSLVSILAATEGDPRSLRRLANPSIWARLTDKTQFLYVNNLLWSPKTHAINFATNTFMIAARPAERYIGSFYVGGAQGSAIRMEAVKQFQYMASSLIDGLKGAGDAWRQADSVISPRNAEVNNIGLATGQEIAAMQFKSWDSLSNVIYNAFLPAVKTMGFPTRMLGTVDELTKQMVYRSKVQAAAFVEGTGSGLTGKDLEQFIRTRLDESFDEVGRGIDGQALQEARIATFSQDLLPGTAGKTVQTAVNNHPVLRFVLPFVKTPTNVFREGLKMTPGLNLLQQEYRSMLSGTMGAEAQAQAVGQMAVGSLLMGTAGLLAGSGLITGAGPSDRTQKQTMQSTGWQPYSFVFTRADGGKTYLPFNRLDPVAMPFGVVADLADAINTMDDDDPLMAQVQAGATAALFGIVKQLGNKTYLQGVNQVVELVAEGNADKAGAFFGTMASNLVPMAAGLRLFNQDPYLRDARTFTDKIMATIPGLSETVPARYDIWGEPRGVVKGFWNETPNDAVDHEVRRMIMEGEVGLAPPSAYAGGVDLREVKTVDGKNAYEVYQQLAGKISPNAPSLKDIVAKIIQTEGYQKAPDGDSRVKGTKQAMLASAMADYREDAMSLLKGRDANVREAMLAEQRRVAAAYSSRNATATREPKVPGAVESFLGSIGLGGAPGN